MTRTAFTSLLVLACLGPACRVSAADQQPIPPDRFRSLHEMIKPQPGESRFREIPWLLNLDDALRQGAREGKPILVWCGAGGAPHTVC